MEKVHLFSNKSSIDVGAGSMAVNKTQCGVELYLSQINYISMIDYKEVTCENCKRSARYKELKELDKTMSEIKTEAYDDFEKKKIRQDEMIRHKNTKPNSHYNQGSTPTIEKINEVLEHLEGKINNKQAAQIYNMLKYWDRSEHKGTSEKDLFKCADSICNAITGEFINEKN